MQDTERQAILDDEHLRLLRIGYFIQGGTTFFVCLFGLLYVFMGIFAFSSFGNTPTPRGTPPPQFFGYILAWMGGLFTLGGAVLTALKFLTARALGRRRSRALCMVTAALSCIFVPYGTALGIFTFLVLERPSVRALFNSSPPASPAA